MMDLAYCKSCRNPAVRHNAITARRCPACGGTDYILPGLSAVDLSAYYANRAAWDMAKATLLAADLEPWELNERHGDLQTMQECATWVELQELMALDAPQLHDVICQRYGQQIASWYCDDFLGGYEQRCQTNASAKASGRTG